MKQLSKLVRVRYVEDITKARRVGESHRGRAKSSVGRALALGMGPHVQCKCWAGCLFPTQGAYLGGTVELSEAANLTLAISNVV